MGVVIGCTRKYCLEKITKEVDVDIKQNNIKTTNTINTNNNEKMKLGLNKPEKKLKSKNNIEDDENEQDKEEEEEKEEEEKRHKSKFGEKSRKKTNDFRNDFSKMKSMQRLSQKKIDITQTNNDSYKRTGTKRNLNSKQKGKTAKSCIEKCNTINFSTTQLENNFEKPIRTIHKIKFPASNEKNWKISGKSDEEEIISVEQPYMSTPVKNSSKNVNNFKSLQALKSSLMQNSLSPDPKKKSVLKLGNTKMNAYLRILSDFGEKGHSCLKNNTNDARNSRIRYLMTKDRKDKNIKINKYQDDIRGNFLLKNEKVIRYQGGFIKKTKKKNGFGIVTWSDNSSLYGVYVASAINGYAQFNNNKFKSSFYGEYHNNMPQGFGIYKVKGLTLIGFWNNSTLNGIAIEVWPDGSYYQGEYFNNKKNGVGLYRWPDGTIYQGEFRNGNMTGNGIIFYSDDSAFSGEMLNGYMNGYGIFSWSNGALYMGYYLQDIKHGFGIYVWDSKKFICYIGFWDMGKQQGIGAKVNGNKVKYCIWKKGKISITLKGLYEIDKYLIGDLKKYQRFFTPGYINKLRISNFYDFDQK